VVGVIVKPQLWRFYKSMDENVIASSTDLIERMMRKVARFPVQDH
jgi:hypothetical protein